jgi:hypothetical protein
MLVAQNCPLRGILARGNLEIIPRLTDRMQKACDYEYLTGKPFVNGQKFKNKKDTSPPCYLFQ